ERAPDHETERGLPVLQDQEQDDQWHRDRGDDRVLTVEVGLRTLLDRPRDLAHALVAGRFREQALGHYESVGDGRARAHERDDNPVIGQEVGQVSFLRWIWRRGSLSAPGASKRPDR